MGHWGKSKGPGVKPMGMRGDSDKKIEKKLAKLDKKFQESEEQVAIKKGEFVGEKKVKGRWL
jgi:hypothetical protein